MLLEGKSAIVTGAASGIGKSIAVKFAAEGCAVAVCDIDEAKGKKVAEEINRAKGRAIFIKCDVTDYKQIEGTVAKAIKEFGKIDILVNNAGGVSGRDMPTENVSEGDWDQIVNLNLKSQFLFCKAVIPHMKARKYGKIVNLSSLGAVSPPAPIAHYHAAKGGVIGLTNNLAYELAAYNINVNCILPGPILTEFFDTVTKDMPDKEAFFKRLADIAPLKRLGKPEDIAGVALFLASELASYVTGESINAGGGTPLKAT